MLKIYKLGEEVLRQKAEPITEVTDEIRILAQDMIATMKEHKGVGLAGPQVGKLLRIFVACADDDIPRIFINPQIISTSQELSDYEEGCLSIPGIYETIRRPMKVSVQALNEQGKAFTIETDGLLARIIQHEMDHLNGILFLDRGDKSFAKKTEEQFKRRAEKLARKQAAKEKKLSKKK
ncbi:MAG: peptide deformylase [Treponema sp.]|nr:peptide deformylase [Treponema sp.]